MEDYKEEIQREQEREAREEELTQAGLLKEIVKMKAKRRRMEEETLDQGAKARRLRQNM